MSSRRLFCRGVPVSSKRCSACGEHGRINVLMKNAPENTCSRRESVSCQWTYVNSHEVAVAQRVHVLQHVAFVKQGVLQTQLAKQAAVAVISDRQVVPVESNRSKGIMFTQISSYCGKIKCERCRLCAYVVTMTLYSMSSFRMSCLRYRRSSTDPGKRKGSQYYLIIYNKGISCSSCEVKIKIPNYWLYRNRWRPWGSDTKALAL